MAFRDRMPPMIRYVGVLVAAAGFGLLAGGHPGWAVGAAAAWALLVLMFANLPAGLCVLVFISALQDIPAASGLVSAAKIVGLLVVLAWTARSVVDPAEPHPVRLPSPLKLSVAALMTLVLVSISWASNLPNWIDAAQSWVLNLALIPIVFAVLRERRHVVWLFGTFVFGAVLATALGITNATPATVGDRIGGGGLNPNALGAGAATAAVLGITLILSMRRRGVGRALTMGGVAFCLFGLVLSASRGSLLGFAAALLAAPFVLGARRRVAALSFAATTAATIVVYLFAFAPASSVQRIVYSDASGSGRTDIWTVGLRVVEAHPTFGVGAGNFSSSTIVYLLHPGVLRYSRYIVDQPKVAHNIYLQVLAELGVVGFVLFAVVLGWSLTCARRAALGFAEAGDRSGELLARGLLLALIGLLIADFFSSQLYSKQLWLLLATGPALLAISQRQVGVRQRLF